MFLLSGVGTILFSLFGWASVRGAEILQMIAGELGIPLSSIGTSFNLFSLHNLIGTAARIASSFDFDELSSVRSFLSVLIAILLAGFGCLIFAAVWHFKGKQWKVFAAFGFILVLILIILWILAVLLINFAAREEFGFALLRLSKPSFIVLASCVVGLISLKKAKA
ncbi:MAG: hypothetical protein FWB76_00870 [Oscillospiraceae bacterium]|nr:hypothetical protein [Oscillospiraceae bacterium]